MAVADSRPIPPELRGLRRVIPIGQTQVNAGWTITGIALEAYEDGFRLTFRVYGPGKQPDPELALRVRDDRGGAYWPWAAGGHGEPATDACDWRLSYACTPRLDELGQQLHVVVDEIQATGVDTAHHQIVVEHADAGPWVFVIDLH